MSLVEALRLKIVHQSIPLSTSGSTWTSLYKIARVAAFIILAFIPIQMVVFFAWPPPVDVQNWFQLLVQYPLIGLLDLDLLLIIDYILMAIIFLAFYVSLREKNRSIMLLSLLMQFMSVITYFSSTIAFEMLSLSHQYAASSSESTQTMLLTAGQSLLVNWQGTAFNVSYELGAVALLLLSIVILRTSIFSKAIGYLTLIIGVLMIVPPTVGKAGVALSILSLVPTMIWLVMISRRFAFLADEEKIDQ